MSNKLSVKEETYIDSLKDAGKYNDDWLRKEFPSVPPPSLANNPFPTVDEDDNNCKEW